MLAYEYCFSSLGLSGFEGLDLALDALVRGRMYDGRRLVSFCSSHFAIECDMSLADTSLVARRLRTLHFYTSASYQILSRIKRCPHRPRSSDRTCRT